MNTSSRNDSPAPDNDASERKARHLDICLNPQTYDVEFGSTGFEYLRFVHKSLPEVSDAEIDTTTEFLGRRISLPLFVSSMTGGSDLGYNINKNLARAAQILGVPVGMGSIRILFRKPEVIDHFRLKSLAPDVPVLANIGAVQVRDTGTAAIVEMLERLEVQGLSVHLNPGQELFQPEGDRDFRGVLDAIRRFCEKSPVPVIVKETGFGMRPSEAMALLDAGAAYVNIAGSGGTNWATVEAHRLSGTEAEPAREFDTWGIPTALALAALGLRDPELEPSLPAGAVAGAAGAETDAARRTQAGRGSKVAPAARAGLRSPTAPRSTSASHGAARRDATPSNRALLPGRILASGGLRSGMDLAKSLALGASLGGYALPFVRAVAAEGVDGVVRTARSYERVLRSVMLLTGCTAIDQLRQVPLMAASSFVEAARRLQSI